MSKPQIKNNPYHTLKHIFYDLFFNYLSNSQKDHDSDYHKSLIIDYIFLFSLFLAISSIMKCVYIYILCLSFKPGLPSRHGR